MNQPTEVSSLAAWSDSTKIPYEFYTDPEIYQLEMERIFRGPFWHPVALVAEIPTPNDFKTLTVGETPVLVTHSEDGQCRAFINACAHRGVQLTVAPRGSAKRFTCPYHRWVFATDGSLLGAPGDETFPAAFCKSESGLKELKTVNFYGVIFATFDPDNTPPIEVYFGRVGDALKSCVGDGTRPLKLLGYQKVVFNCNWKVYMDNDGYHAGLLHTAFRLLNFQGGKGELFADGPAGNWGMAYAVERYKDNGFLSDPELVEVKGDETTAAGALIRPVTQVVRHFNSINFRFGRPLGVDKTEVHYGYYGYEDDSPEMLKHRVRQSSNLLGPSGFVSIEDGSVFDRCQKGVTGGVGTMNFVKGIGTAVPDRKTSAQNDETVSTVWWSEYKQLMGY
ncbi:MAG: aromatic ring-hydroxylating dioxygenase subunit alpha [Gammaproteobacteria bacterium]|nr:aromatic ring-hydroxylating dioxygenase subunit alpha [Gammaproteobacteria bacterium]